MKIFETTTALSEARFASSGQLVQVKGDSAAGDGGIAFYLIVDTPQAGDITCADGKGARKQQQGNPSNTGRNLLMNAGFDVQQRGADDLINFSNGYAFDRWYSYSSASGTQRVTRIQNAYDFRKGAYRVDMRNDDTSAQVLALVQPIELTDNNPRPFLQGSSFVMSGWCYRDSAGTMTLYCIFRDAPVDLTGEVLALDRTISLDAGWNRVEEVFTIDVVPPTDKAALTVWWQFNDVPSNERGMLSDLQIEEGSAATPFDQRPVHETLAACQRYFFKSGPWDISIGGSIVSATSYYYSCQHPTALRRVPTTQDYTLIDSSTSRFNPNTLGVSSAGLSTMGSAFNAISVSTGSGYYLAGYEVDVDF